MSSRPCASRTHAVVDPSPPHHTRRHSTRAAPHVPPSHPRRHPTRTASPLAPPSHSRVLPRPSPRLCRKHREFYEYGLLPGVHYVAVDTAADVPAMVRWLRQNDDYARSVALAGRARMSTLSIDAVADFMAELLRQYAKKQTFRVAPLAGAVKIACEDDVRARLLANAPTRSRCAAVTPPPRPSRCASRHASPAPTPTVHVPTPHLDRSCTHSCGGTTRANRSGCAAT